MRVKRSFVPPDFEIPEGIETESFRLRMLSVRDVEIDYEAVMSSVEHLQQTYSVLTGSEWPAGLTLEEDLIDLGWHQREFTLRSSFAYTVVTLDSRCLGCVYIDPTQKHDHDAEVRLWVRVSELDSGLDAELFEVVGRWIAKEWPFANPAFPLREIPLVEWESLPEDA